MTPYVLFLTVGMVAIALILFVGWLDRNSSKILEATYDEGKKIMTVKYSGHTAQFYEDIIWYTYPQIRACDDSTQRQLYQIHKYIKVHGNPYPTAHKDASTKA